MTMNHDLIFDLVDLPFGGKDLSGEISPEDLGLKNEERLVFTDSVKYKLHLAPVNSGNDLLVVGTVDADIQFVCDRCDGNAQRHLANLEVCHEYENAFGTTLNLTDDIREDILFALPQHFLCKDDCKGFCLRCGQNLNLGSCDCEDEDDIPPEENGGGSPWDCLDNLKIQ